MTIGWNPSPGGGGAVDSVFARTGAVVAAIGDYTSEQITDPTFGDVKIACEQLDALALTVDDKADSDSPTFTGDVNGSGATTFSVPTVVYPNNTTAAASTAFVTAALATVTGTGSATWAANSQTVWSYTLSEGEVYGGAMTIVTRHTNGSTLSRSIADVSFVGSREAGGAAQVTQGTAAENGSGALASGTVTATAVGNTIAVRLTFPSLNGTAYYAWSHKPLIPPNS